MPEKNTAATGRAEMPALPDGDRHLTAAEVAEISGLSVRTLRDYRSPREAVRPPILQDGWAGQLQPESGVGLARLAELVPWLTRRF